MVLLGPRLVSMVMIGLKVLYGIVRFSLHPSWYCKDLRGYHWNLPWFLYGTVGSSMGPSGDC